MRIFLAAPISGFENENEYLTYRKKVVELIDGLKKSFVVMSELERVESVGSYDSPEQSVIKDFTDIKEADCFMLLHPRRMQTSAFIELGYAYAMKKPSLIIAHPKDLPYMALGLNNKSVPSLIVSPDATNLKNIIMSILTDWEKNIDNSKPREHNWEV